MMRNMFLLAAVMMSVAAAAQEADGMQVVVTNDGMLMGRFVRETDSTLVANPLDWEDECPKSQCHVEYWTPEAGKGFVYRRDGVTGNLNVRKYPDTKAPVVAQITPADSMKEYPDCFFDCLGKTNGWYKIRIKGKVGYIRGDLVGWAAYFAD